MIAAKAIVTVRPKGHEDPALQEQQAGALELDFRIKCDAPRHAATPITRDRALDRDRPTRAELSVGQIECMEAVDLFMPRRTGHELKRLGDDKKSLRTRVDYRRACDTILGSFDVARGNLGVRNANISPERDSVYEVISRRQEE